jgi:hypothetical protein
LSVTTFTLTFFLNQSYALWRKCYELSRRLQGRLNDLGMTLAAHAARKTPADPSESSTYTSGSRQMLELMGRYIRLFNLLTYASFTRSHRPILTPRGMRRMVERGLLTPAEREALVAAEVPATQRHNAVVLWIMRMFMEGRTAGHFQGGDGFEQQFLEKIHVIRAQYGAIGDELQGRMPLAYAHIVQVLVDCVLWMYPLMAYSTDMAPFLGILGTGLLTMSYQGLFDLAKQFLDPYDNENYGRGDDPLCVDTLVAETNSGSVRWLNGFNEMPFSSQRIKDGELFDYQLPIRGYSVEELAQMEEERIEKERELQERREREEAERARQAEVELEKINKLNELRNATQANATDFSDDALGVANDTITAPAPSSDATTDVDVRDTEKTSVPQESLMDIAAETEKDDDTQVETPSRGHRVTSLGDGRPITYSKTESPVSNVTELTVPENTEAGPENATVPVAASQQFNMTDLAGATLAAAASVSAAANARAEKGAAGLPQPSSSVKPNGESDQQEPVAEVKGVGPDLMMQPDFNFFDMDNVNWFDEVGGDGQEYRLSQMMADEEWEETSRYEEEKKLREPSMSFEEYRESVVELIEAASDELKETRDILSSDWRQLEAAPKRKQVPLKYDQTKLDGISQLWGLPPSDLSDLEVIEEPAFEEKSFNTIMTLWGKPPAEYSQEEGPMIGSNFKGVSDLWDSNSDRGPSNDFSDLPWINEVDSDGQEFRLSQMLAEEEWEEFEPPVVEAPLSLDDYSKQVTEAYQDLEEELKETEAILNAPPGADYAEYDSEEIEDTSDEDDSEAEWKPEKAESVGDATSEIRAEVQAAYEAAKEEEEKVEQALELRSKTADDPLALLLDELVPDEGGNEAEFIGMVVVDSDEDVDEVAGEDTERDFFDDDFFNEGTPNGDDSATEPVGENEKPDDDKIS